MSNMAATVSTPTGNNPAVTAEASASESTAHGHAAHAHKPHKHPWRNGVKVAIIWMIGAILGIAGLLMLPKGAPSRDINPAVLQQQR